MRKILLCENALPTPLFRRLVDAVHAVGTERLKQNGSYTTTFWFPLGAKPANVAEEAIVKLWPLVRPGSIMKLIVLGTTPLVLCAIRAAVASGTL